MTKIIAEKNFDIADLYGMIKNKKKVTIKQMKKVIRQRVVTRHKNR